MAIRRVLSPRVGDRPTRAVIRAAGDDSELGLGDNPLDDLDGDEPLHNEFYSSPPPTLVEATPGSVVMGPTTAVSSTQPVNTTATATTMKLASRSRGRQPLPDGRTFRLVTFSFYEDDVARLDALLKVARQKGQRRASRSQIVRQALRQVDLDTVPDDT